MNPSGMRVALAFPGCHRKGGGERGMLECANFLAARGHDANVLAADWDQRFLSPLVTLHPVRAAARPPVLRVLSYARGSRAELARLNPPAEVLATFGVLCPPGGVMWVQSVQKAWLEISQSQRNFAGRWRQNLNPFHPVILAMERRHFRHGSYKKLIALTTRVKQDLTRLYDVPENDISILPNGFAPDEFNVARRSELRPVVRHELGYADDQKIVIFAANELERKGFGPLLRAIALLRDPDVNLLAVGRLDARRYAAEIARLGMTDRVRFTGPTSDVARYFSAADAFALPTQYEAWGMVVVEAMACGLPALTSRLAGAAVVVRENQTGCLLDDPRDESEIAAKLRPLLDGRHESVQAISRSVDRYSWPSLLPKYEQLLFEAARGGAPPQEQEKENAELAAGVPI
jgi:UDP-glucose:(heptosyl)LPS alpha-1,3-glucosyltransferase